MNNKWFKSFFTFYIGQSFSLLGSNSAQFAIIWWITINTGSAVSLTTASIVGLLPQAFLGPFAGVIIDRFNKKTVLILADLLVGISSLILGLFFYLGEPSLSLIYVILFLRALGATFHSPTTQAIIPEIVPRTEIKRAASFMQMINSGSNILSPMLGSFLVSAFTMEFVMLIDIVGALMASFMIFIVKIERSIKHNGNKVIQDLKVGLNSILKNTQVLKLSLFIMISSFILAPFGSLLPLMVEGYFNGNAFNVGTSQTIYSLGMLISASTVAFLKINYPTFFTVSLSFLIFGVSVMLSGFLPESYFIYFLVFLFLSGAGASISNIAYNSYIQENIPKENLGKVFSLIRSSMTLAVPIGLFILGPLADIVGINIWMRYIGFSMIFASLICYISTKKYKNV